MTEVVLFPDVEEVLGAYLTAGLGARSDSAVVVRAGIDSSEQRLVRIRAEWGPDSGRALSTRYLTVQCADATHADAAQLAELCFAILRAAQHDHAVPRVRDVATIDRPESALPQPDPPAHNYQFTLAVLLRGQPE